ncbi:MAG TPA: hypothetical protein VNW04_09930 [Puia sp.]|nr:hypothetical protein [Puia sp.]
MKSSILLLACSTSIVALTSKAQSTSLGNAVAQNNKPPAQLPKAQPTQRAIHQLEILQERVDLTPDQVQIVNMVYLEENMALDSLIEHPSTDPKTDNQARRDIYHNADISIYACLNDSQQLQYVLWKQEQRIRNLEKRNKTTQAALDSLSRQQPPVH